MTETADIVYKESYSFKNADNWEGADDWIVDRSCVRRISQTSTPFPGPGGARPPKAFWCILR